MVFVIIYFTLFLFVHPLANIIFQPENRVKAECFACFMLLYLFFGFRDLPVLNDTSHYYEHFENTLALINTRNSIFEIDRFDRLEKGYLIYENILAFIFNHPYAIINISSLIISIFFVFVISKLVDNVGIVCFMLLGTTMLTSYSGLRQGIACCLVYLAFLYLLKKNYYLYTFFIFFSVFFHSSALFVAPIIFFTKIRLNKKVLLLLFGIILFVYYRFTNLWEFIGRGDSIYIETSMLRESLPIASFVNLIVGLLFLLTTWFLNKRNNIQWEPLYWWLSIFNCCFLFLDLSIQVVSRFSMYLYLFSIIFWWKNLIACDMYTNKKTLCAMFICLFLSKWMITFTYKPEWFHITPYTTYDFTQKVHDTRLGY